MRLITISREYGAGGGEVAARLADLLGWELLDCELPRHWHASSSPKATTAAGDSISTTSRPTGRTRWDTA